MPVEVDTEGLVVDRLPADCHVVCVTPCHQFPTGVAMSLDRGRRALLDFAASVAAFISEGHLIQHVRRMREAYRERLLAAQGALSSVLADWLSRCRPPTGCTCARGRAACSTWSR